MNDTEIKPRYIPEESGNALPNLGKHGAFNEPPIPINRPRAEPSRAMTDSPQKYLLPGGAELRDIIKRRIDATSQSTKALCAALARAYQIRGGHYEAVMNEIATMINSGDLAQRDGELHIAEPPVTEIPAEMWTMTHTQRLMHVLGDEPQTREALARQTGLKPRQVSKAAYLLIQQGCIEVVGDVPRTWRLADSRPAETEPETAVLTEQQTRDVLLERVGNGSVPITVVIDDVARLSGWQRAAVSTLIDGMLTEGDTIRFSDGRIGRPKPVSYQEMVARSEDPPAYEIGDDDDGEIGEPGISRPDAPAYVLDSATIDFVQRDSGGYVADECSVTIDAAGLSFGGGDVMPFEAIDAVMPTLKRVHRALFGDGDEAV